MSTLQLRNLVKRYGGLLATDHVNLDIAPGEIHALIGPNGAGKTTLIQQISGAIPPTSGHILLDGQDITPLSMHERVHRGLVRSFQISQLFLPLTVRDNLALAVQARSGSSMRFWRAVRNDSALFIEADRLAKAYALHEYADQTVDELAHGQRRQLEFALAVALQPRVLLLDEPMAGMGQEESHLLTPHIAALRGKVSVILVEHDMQAVFALADRISVLVAGRLIASGRPEDIRQNDAVKRAYLGDSLELA